MHQFIRQAYVDVGKLPADLDSQGAFRQLLRSSRVYASDRLELQSFARDLVSWPDVGSTKVSLLDVVPPAACEGLSDWKRHLLRDPDDARRPG